MKRFPTLFFVLFTILSRLTGQAPVNDDCNGIIDLGTAPYCEDSVFYTNVNATPSDIGSFTTIPNCLSSGNSPRDVWFQFTANPAITDYVITVTGADDGNGNPLSTPQLVLYRGFCQYDELLILDCKEAPLGSSEVSLQVTGLTPGLTYFLRVGDYSPFSDENSGTFKICIQEKDPEWTVDQDSSTACNGVLYDTGGPNGDYGANEDYVFKICPAEPHQCISFQLEYYNLENGELDLTDHIILYDGPDVNSPVLADIGGANFPKGAGPNDGGVCFQTYATSGCLTVEFISDGNLQFEGFKAKWECSPSACPQPEPLAVDSLADTTTILNYLNSTFANTTLDTIICDNQAYGTFVATDNTGLGIEKGLFLSSGKVTDAIGPNDDTGIGDGFDLPGDPDLDSLSNVLGDGTESHDACVVVLDVFAYTDKLTFEYVFGSDEYEEFVGSSFNDIFAFFVSGPGITGKKNIAIIPGTANEPVQINSVNQISHWPYYRDNSPSPTLQYDGLTSDSLGIKKSLTAQVDVIPCNSYKLKLAVADRGDDIFDSGVFISDIRAGLPSLKVNFKNGLDYFVEYCNTLTDSLTIGLSGEVTDTSSFTVSIGGTATNGVDYILNIPPTLVFSPTQTSYTFPIVIVNDTLQEGTETITITVSNDFGCGNVVVDQVITELKDNIDVNVEAQGDTLDVCANTPFEIAANGAAVYHWTPESLFDDPDSRKPTVTVSSSQWVYVEGQAGICLDVDSVYLNAINVQVTALVSDTAICLGDTVQLNCVPSVANPTYSWEPAFLVSDPTIKSPQAAPFSTTIYTVTIDAFGCQSTDTVTVKVDTLFEPVLIADTSICLGNSVQLASSVPFFSTSDYSWNPAGTLDDPTVANPTATPGLGTTVYTLTTTSANGYCSNQQAVAVTTIPASLQVVEHPDLVTKDSIFLCAPDSVNLLAITSTNGAGLTWSPDNGTLSSLTDTLVTVHTSQSGYYYATLTVSSCVLRDSVWIQTDSMPADLSLTAVPFKDPYCPGDTVSIFSPNYDHNLYKHISHQWAPATGVISDLDNYNLVVITDDTITYTRITHSGVCVDSAQITLNVEQPADIQVTQDKDTICAGEAVQLTATSDAGDNFKWLPESGLSCADCPNPVATPSQSITYSVMLEGANCPSSETANIFVRPTPVVQFPADNQLCPGESITLNEAPDPAYTYVWTADDPNFGTVHDAAPTVTPSQTTTYVATVSNGGCTITDSLTVTVAQDQLSIDGPAGICQGQSAVLTAVTNGNGDYLWTPGDVSGPSIDVMPDTATTYSVTYTYGDGCTLSASHDLQVYPGYTFSAAADKDTVYSEEVYQVHAMISPNAQGGTFTWTVNGQQVFANGPDISVKASDGPIDEIVVGWVTPEGCEYFAAVTVVVLPLKYEIPTAFTPNGDGINETFRPATLLGYEMTKMIVYSRWGQKVYEGESSFKGWDGTYKGKDMPADVYPYYIRLKRPDGQVVELKGDVTLIR